MTWNWVRQAGFALVVVLAGAGTALAQASRPDPESIVPLPAAFEMAPPAADVPAELARFQGAWAGIWEDEFRNILVVEKIEKDGRAQVVYGWADSAFIGVSRGWVRTEAKSVGETLTVQRFGWTDSFTIDGANRLFGSSAQRTGRVMAGLFERRDVATMAGGRGTVERLWPGERVRIPHLTLRSADGSKPLELEG